MKPSPIIISTPRYDIDLDLVTRNLLRKFVAEKKGSLGGNFYTIKYNDIIDTFDFVERIEIDSNINKLIDNINRIGSGRFVIDLAFRGVAGSIECTIGEAPFEKGSHLHFILDENFSHCVYAKDEPGIALLVLACEIFKECSIGAFIVSSRFSKLPTFEEDDVIDPLLLMEDFGKFAIPHAIGYRIGTFDDVLIEKYWGGELQTSLSSWNIRIR